MQCERCRTTTPAADDLFDYCANCGKNLCGKCMAEGCCGQTPAQSGQDDDYGDDEASNKTETSSES